MSIQFCERCRVSSEHEMLAYRDDKLVCQECDDDMNAAQQILLALQKKGLSASECHYVNAAVAGGWCIELDSQSLDLLEDYGVEADDMYPICDTAAEALEWIASLPDCFDGASDAT